MAQKAPRGYELITDVNERIQRGDILWHDDNADWEEAGRAEIGDYASGYHAAARPSPVKLVRRSIRPKGDSRL